MDQPTLNTAPAGDDAGSAVGTDMDVVKLAPEEVTQPEPDHAPDPVAPEPESAPEPAPPAPPPVPEPTPAPALPHTPWERLLAILHHAEVAAADITFRITKVWHPDPQGGLWHGTYGSAAVEEGPPAYQLGTGEIITL